MDFDFDKELKKIGLIKIESEAEDREPIDFSISNEEDNKCWVWGSEPWTDIQVECNHPDEAIEWGDDDERGYCVVCGKECDWHYENQVVDEGHTEDGDYICLTAPVKVIDEWHDTDNKGLIGKYLDQLGRSF